MIYSMFVPIVFSVSHTASLYLIFQTMPHLGAPLTLTLCVLYFLSVVSLYIVLYSGLKEVFDKYTPGLIFVLYLAVIFMMGVLLSSIWLSHPKIFTT